MNRSEIQQLIDSHGGHFTVDELRGISTKGNPENFKRSFLDSLFGWRGWHGFSTMLLSGYRPSSDEDDAHNGWAGDVVLWEEWKKRFVDPYQQWLLATTWPFQGVGIYFDWSYNGKPVVGLHVDNLDNNRRPVRWLRLTMEVNGKEQQYYFYQSIRNGRFFNKDLNESITLDEAINQFNNTQQNEGH